MADFDHTDCQVVGTDRYFPTTRARSLLVLLIAAPLSVAAFFLSNQDGGEVSKLLGGRLQTAIVLSSLVALFFSVLLVVELAVVINHKKHARIFHLTNHNELMSFVWLYKNASPKHWIFISSICAVSFYAGFYVANL